MSDLKSTSFISPAKMSSTVIMVYAFILGLLLKWCDVIGDKELFLNEDQYAFHSKLAIVIFSLASTHFCLANMTCAAMGSGLMIGCVLGMKIDIIEHIIPTIVIVTVPYVIAHVFKDASWNGLDFSRASVYRGIATWVFICLITGFEEIFHEIVDDHPNETFRYIIDKRPVAPMLTGIAALIMSTNLCSKNVKNLCEWNMIFLNTTVFQCGYETMRHIRDFLNATVLQGNVQV